LAGQADGRGWSLLCPTSAPSLSLLLTTLISTSLTALLLHHSYIVLHYLTPFHYVPMTLELSCSPSQRGGDALGPLLRNSSPDSDLLVAAEDDTFQTSSPLNSRMSPIATGELAKLSFSTSPLPPQPSPERSTSGLTGLSAISDEQDEEPESYEYPFGSQEDIMPDGRCITVAPRVAVGPNEPFKLGEWQIGQISSRQPKQRFR
jgi:hypothetical protein